MTTKILLADDEEDVLSLMAATLWTRGGYEVYLARDGEEALKLAKLHMPDIVLLDVVMPKKYGWDVCQELKLSPNTKHIKVIMLTALAQESTKRKAYDVGADYYITKPFDPEQLLEKVEEVKVRLPKNPSSMIVSEANTKVVICGDEKGQVGIINGALRGSGSYDTIVAWDREMAWKMATQEMPDILILKTEIHGRSGLELCRRLKANRATQEIKIIVYSADFQDSVINAALAAGADDYFATPVHSSRLLELVATVKDLPPRLPLTVSLGNAW